MICAVSWFTTRCEAVVVETPELPAVVDNRALSAASEQAVQNKIPLIVLFLLSPQDYIAHDRSKRRIDFVLRNLAEIKVMV